MPATGGRGLVRVLAASAALVMVGFLFLLAPLLLLEFGADARVAFPLSLLAGGALGGVVAGSLLARRPWAPVLSAAIAGVLGLLMAVQVVEEARGPEPRNALPALAYLALSVAAIALLLRLRKAPAPGGPAAPPARPAWPTWLAAALALLVLALLGLPWAEGEARVQWFGTRAEPSRAYLGLELVPGAASGALALFGAGLLAVAPAGRLPRVLAALAVAGAAVAALLPYTGVTVCGFGFLASPCLPEPDVSIAPAVAGAAALVVSAFLLISARDAQENVK